MTRQRPERPPRKTARLTQVKKENGQPRKEQHQKNSQPHSGRNASDNNYQGHPPPAPRSTANTTPGTSGPKGLDQTDSKTDLNPSESNPGANARTDSEASRLKPRHSMHVETMNTPPWGCSRICWLSTLGVNPRQRHALGKTWKKYRQNTVIPDPIIEDRYAKIAEKAKTAS